MKRYIINHDSDNREVHRREHLTGNCRVNQIKNKEETDDYNYVYRLLQNGYNGCYWCYRSQHTG